MAVQVFQYGIRLGRQDGAIRVGGDSARRAELGDDPLLLEQLRLVHELKCDLVGLERRREEAMRNLWSGFPDVKAAEERIDAAEAEVMRLVKQAKTEHAADRSTATRPATSTALREARAVLVAARTDRGAAITASLDAATPHIEAIDADFAAAVLDLYAEYCGDGSGRGLYWATFNAAKLDHLTAMKLIDQKRAQGRPGELRVPRWTGEGTIAVQLQRAHGPECRCSACTTKRLGSWRVTPDDTWLLLHRRIPNPKKAAAILAAGLGIPAAALRVVEQAPGLWAVEVANPGRLPPAPGDVDHAHPAVCRCPACVTGHVTPWRVDLNGAKHTLSSRAPHLAAAATILVTAVAGVPAEAVDVVACQGRRKGDTYWQVKVANPQLLAGLPGPKDPPRTPALLASGRGKWRNVFQLSPWVDPAEWQQLSGQEQRARSSGQVSLCVGAGRMLRLPVTVHRMMDADADIAEAQLTRIRVGAQVRLTLAVTAKLPAPQPAGAGPTVALHLGWRRRDDATIRVATWAATEPLTVPPTVADVVIAYYGGRWGEIITPARLAAADRPDSLRGIRDRNLQPALQRLAEWLEAYPDACDDRLTPALVRQWRAPARLAALILRWRATPPNDNSYALLRDLEQWRLQDKHLWQWESHERRQLAACRDDAWRRAAAWIAANAATLVVDDADMATLRRRGDEADTDPVLPGGAAQTARARAALAAPGRLRLICRTTATRRGLSIAEVAAGPNPHRRCGTQAPAELLATAAVITCPGCGASYDQDYNAARLMLRRQASR